MNFMVYTKLQFIVRILKRRRVRWAGHVARTGETSNVFRMLVGKTTMEMKTQKLVVF